MIPLKRAKNKDKILEALAYPERVKAFRYPQDNGLSKDHLMKLFPGL